MNSLGQFRINIPLHLCWGCLEGKLYVQRRQICYSKCSLKNVLGRTAVKSKKSYFSGCCPCGTNDPSRNYCNQHKRRLIDSSLSLPNKKVETDTVREERVPMETETQKQRAGYMNSQKISISLDFFIYFWMIVLEKVLHMFILNKNNIRQMDAYFTLAEILDFLS